MRKRTVLFVVVVLGFLSVPLSAQTGSLRERDRDPEGRKRLLADLQRARLQYGPFYLLSRIELRNLGFDQEISAPTREELDDFSATIAAPQKLFFVPSKKFVLSAQAEPAYVWFEEREELRDWNHLVRGDAHLLLNRLYVDAFVSRANETVRDLAEVSQLVNRKAQMTGVETEIKFSSKTEIRLRGLVNDIEYERADGSDTPARLLDRSENINTFVFRHQTLPRTALSLTFDAQNFDFDVADDRDGDLQTIYVGAERAGTGARSIEAPIRIRAGYASLDYSDPLEEDYQGVVGNAAVSLAPHRRLIVDLSAERRLQFSVFENNNHFAEDRARFIATYSIGRRLDLVGSLEQGVNRYFIEALDPDTGESKLREDDITFNSAGFKYRILRSSSLGAGVGYYRRDSNFERFTEDGIRLFVQLSISP